MIRCGFYNSMNGDRTYYAEDMTKPYDKLVSNGVYASPAGQFKVTAAGGMQVQVSPGAAKVGARWVESDAIETLTLDPADVALPQIYTVVLRDDATEAVRSVGVYLKKGQLASAPTPPEIERGEDVYELQLAQIRVERRTQAITDADITDTRANTELCGWVTGLIEQVDTTTLFTQWQSAYEQEFERQQEQTSFNQQEFDRWLTNVKSTYLPQATIVRRQSAELTTQSSTTALDIGIADFNRDLDVLTVHIDGALVPESAYTYTETQITLQEAVPAGAKVVIEALKSVDGKDAETAMQAYAQQEATATEAIHNANAAAQEARQTAAATAEQTVEQIIQAVPVQTGSLLYTGEQQSPTWYGYDSEKLTIGGTTTATDAGEYQVTFTPKPPYKWSDGTAGAAPAKWVLGRRPVMLPRQARPLHYLANVVGGKQYPVWECDGDVTSVGDETVFECYNASGNTQGGTGSPTSIYKSFAVLFSPKANYRWNDDPPVGSTSQKMAMWYIDQHPFLAAHPVGSIFESTTATNPGTLYGGTWAAWGAGRVTVGINTADSDFNAANKTGGGKTHRHNFRVDYSPYYGALVGADAAALRAYRYSTESGGDYLYIGAENQSYNNGLQPGVSTVSAMHSATVGDTDAASTLPPYIVCYRWRRTA